VPVPVPVPTPRRMSFLAEEMLTQPSLLCLATDPAGTGQLGMFGEGGGGAKIRQREHRSTMTTAKEQKEQNRTAVGNSGGKQAVGGSTTWYTGSGGSGSSGMGVVWTWYGSSMYRRGCIGGFGFGWCYYIQSRSTEYVCCQSASSGV
jgi:hypothetical protein